MKKCIICGGDLPPRKSRYCTRTCEKIKRKEDAMAVRVANGDPTVGIGKGGSSKKGKEHHLFSSGIGAFVSIRKEMRKTITNCNRCEKDLTNVDRYGWCVHHIDHDRTNNVRENFEMLCKRCHQVHHDCHLAFNN